jgi:hypothetical protein
MHLSVDLYRAKVLIPTKARTTAGFYMDVEPVEVADITEPHAVQQALKRAWARGNPLVATPSRRDYPRPVVLHHAGVRTWASYEKGVRSWSIDQSGGVFEIIPLRRRRDRGLEEDIEHRKVLPQGAGLDDLAARVAEIVALAAGA